MKLLENWCEEFGPDTFLQQTAQTFTASLNGRISAHRCAAERDLILAYQTGAFSRAAKVQPLQHYLDQLRAPDQNLVHAKLIAAFQSLKARGLPVTITRVPRKGS